MYCRVCGKKIRKKADACAFCGTPTIRHEYKYKKSVMLGSILLCIALAVLGTLLYFKFFAPALRWGMTQQESDAALKKQVYVTESNLQSASESVYTADPQIGNTVFEQVNCTLYFAENVGMYMIKIQFYHDTKTVINALSQKFGAITETLDQTVTAIEWNNKRFGIFYDVEKNSAILYNPSVYTLPEQ